LLFAEETRRAVDIEGSSYLSVHPVTPDRWEDLETLFGPRGAVGGCWCMWFRIRRTEFDRQKGEGNRLCMQAIVASGEVPGLLAYHDGQPVAWCSVGPREVYPVLDRSRVLKRVDDRPVWSVVCFFVKKGYRRMGMSVELLRGAVDYARSQGAKIVEGYPVEPKRGQTADVFAFTGLPGTFLQLGFVEVLRRSETRPIMRYYLES
jgi:GNAT superfamily N-acetyltransferase